MNDKILKLLSQNARYKLCDLATITGLTEEQLRILERYDYTGDLNSIFTQENTVIIGDAISNVRTYDFQVGDTILVSKKTGQIKAVDANLTGRNLIKSQIQFFYYDYYTFTVGAVLHNIPAGSMPIFFNAEDYETVTGKSVETLILNLPYIIEEYYHAS